MAMDTLPGLIEAVGGWLNRRDLAARIPDFLRLCEDDIALKLRDRRMHRTVDAVVSAQPLALPDDWLEAVRVTTLGGRNLQPCSPDQLQAFRAQRQAYGGIYIAGDPSFGGSSHYCITGNTLELHPLPSGDQQLHMVYFQNLPRLTEAAPSHWLLEEDGGLYLYGCLIQAAPYLKDDARVDTWATFYRDRINSRNIASRAAEYSGGPLRRARRGFR